MKRILIIRTSAIGDIVMASPMLGALRKAHPDAFIAWLAEPYTEDLLVRHPDLNRFIAWPKSKWHQMLRRGRLFQFTKTVSRFRSQLHALKFDLAIDAQGLFRSRLLAWMSGAPQRLGLQSKEPGRVLMTRVISRGTDKWRLSSEYRHLMQSLGIAVNDFYPRLHVSEKDRRAAKKLLAALNDHQTPVVICPFTTRDHKHWFDERWAELIGFIHKSLGQPVVILGGDGDRRHARRIANASSGPVLLLAGETSLGQAAAVIEMAAAVIGVDTGLTHMGVALQKPTLPLFGATCPYMETGMDTVRVIYNPMACSPCHRRPTCDNRFDCMQSITVDKVTTALIDMLGKDPKKP